MLASREATMADEELWSVPDVAALIPCPWRRAYDLALSGKFGPPRRQGKTWRVPADGVRAYLATLELKRAARNA